MRWAASGPGFRYEPQRTRDVDCLRTSDEDANAEYNHAA